jgi:hypothetical protein
VPLDDVAVAVAGKRARRPSLGFDDPPRPRPSGRIENQRRSSRGWPGPKSAAAVSGASHCWRLPVVPWRRRTAFATRPSGPRRGVPRVTQWSRISGSRSPLWKAKSLATQVPSRSPGRLGGDAEGMEGA